MTFLTNEYSENIETIKNILPNNLNINSISKKFESGTNSFVFEINDNLIIKFATNEKNRDKLFKEVKLLNIIKGKTTLLIPEPTLYHDNYTYILYKTIPGEIINQEYINLLPSNKLDKFCDDIVKFVFELHKTTELVMSSINLGPWDRSGRNYTQKEIISKFTNNVNFDKEEINFVEQFYQKFNPYLKSDLKRFCHIDVLLKNIAFDKNKQEISGIYDFGEASFDDVHIEFAQMAISFNQEIISKIIKRYNKISDIKIDIQKIYNYRFHLYLCAYLIGWDTKDIIKQRIAYQRKLKFDALSETFSR